MKSTRSIMHTLKEGTADLHKEIESYVPLLNPDLTLVEYRRYLSNILNFYSPIEERIKEFIPTYGDVLCLPRRLKSQWLMADLNSIDTRLQLSSLPRLYQECPPIRSVADLIGVLYVVEGATLGGKIILRALKEHLKLPDDCYRFFIGYGQQTGSMWKDFCVSAERLTVPSFFQQTLDTAKSTFYEFRNCIHPLNPSALNRFS